MAKLEKMQRFIPSLYKPKTNPYVKGMLISWSDEDDRLVQAVQDAKEQLFVKFAQLRFLDALGSNVGVFRPAEINLSDIQFRDLIPALSWNPKQVKPTIRKVLDVFFGENNPLVAIIELNPNEIVIQIPSSVPALRRDLRGANHFKDYTGVINSIDDVLKTMDISLGSSQIVVGGALPPFPNEKFRARFDTADANISDGSATGTLNGSAVISGEKLVTNGAGYIDYDLVGNASINKGTIRFKFTPNFSGSPPGNTFLYHQSLDGSGLGNNSIFIQWSVGGSIGVFFNDESGTTLVSSSFGIFVAVAGITNEWELDYDLDGSGEVRLFVDGIQLGVLSAGYPPQTDTGAPGTIRLGASRISPGNFINGNYDDLQIFSEVQHTANFAGEIPRSIDPTATSIAFVPSTKVLKQDELTDSDFGQFLESSQVVGNAIGTENVEVQFNLSADLSVFQANQTFTVANIVKYPGAFVPDPRRPYSVTKQRGVLGQAIVAGSLYPTLIMQDASGIPDAPGRVAFDFGKGREEGSIKYFGRPNNTTLLLDPSYNFLSDHSIGEAVNVVVKPYKEPRINGFDYSVYMVGVVAARQLAQAIVESVTAAGIVVRWVVVEPKCD